MASPDRQIRVGFDVPSTPAAEFEVEAERRQNRDSLVELHRLLAMLERIHESFGDSGQFGELVLPES